LPPSIFTRSPPLANTLKWTGQPGRLACLGRDDAGLQRVWVWDGLDKPPEAITPEDENAIDYTFLGETLGLAWLRQAKSEKKPGPLTPVLQMRRTGGEVEPLDLGLHLFGYLCSSPDGSYLSFLGRRLQPELASPQLFTLDLSGSGEAPEAVCLTGDLDGWITAFAWYPEGDAILVAIQQGTYARLGKLALGSSGSDWEPWGPQDSFVNGPHIAWDARRLIYLHQDGDQPQRLMIGELDNPDAERPGGPVLTHFNEQLTALSLLGSETFQWENGSGTTLDGLVMRAEGEGPHPVVVWLHGGPAEHISHTFSPYFQVLAAAGFSIFAPNYRGSSARGDGFLRASIGRLGEVDLDDVACGIDAVIDQKIADPEHIALFGWSYGATLALLMAARDDRIKAVIAGSPVIDWVTMFGALWYPSVGKEYFLTDYWDDRTPFDEASPITHVARINCPVLILQGEEDTRVPLNQATLLYRTLLSREVPTDLRYFPKQGHVLTHPASVSDLLERVLLWLETYVTV
jgi:dipeptidyl aminopeptidase/acylaminoacyl peptidase